MQRSAGQLAELSRQLKAKTPRLDAVKDANAGVRLLARQGVDADMLSRDVREFELRTTCVSAHTKSHLLQTQRKQEALPVF